jgi:hypothetical protein
MPTRSINRIAGKVLLISVAIFAAQISVGSSCWTIHDNEMFTNTSDIVVVPVITATDNVGRIIYLVEHFDCLVVLAREDAYPANEIVE